MEPSVERGLCLRNEVQDLEVRRSPWMIRGYSKSKGKYPSEKEAEGDSREKGRHTSKEAGTGEMQPRGKISRAPRS